MATWALTADEPTFQLRHGPAAAGAMRSGYESLRNLALIAINGGVQDRTKAKPPVMTGNSG